MAPLNVCQGILGNREVRTEITAVPPSGVRGEDVS